MKAPLLLPVLFSLALACTLTAQTCREVVRDASGRIVQTIDRQKSAGGTVQATTRDASGRIIGTAATRPNAGGGSQTNYGDASGRLPSRTGSRCLGPQEIALLWSDPKQYLVARSMLREGLESTCDGFFVTEENPVGDVSPICPVVWVGRRC